MDAKLQRRIQRYGWDKAVDCVRAALAATISASSDPSAHDGRLRPGSSVLDVACGTGLVTCRAAVRVGNAGIVIGIDISEHMIEKARARQPGSTSSTSPLTVWRPKTSGFPAMCSMSPCARSA